MALFRRGGAGGGGGIENCALQGSKYHSFKMAVAATSTPQSEAGPSTTSSISSAAASAAVYQRLHPASYLSRYLAKEYRPDGRSLLEWRDVSINAGTHMFILLFGCHSLQAQYRRQMDRHWLEWEKRQWYAVSKLKSPNQTSLHQKRGT